MFPVVSCHITTNAGFPSVVQGSPRYKYPVQEQTPKPPKPCPLDLSEVPMSLPAIPSDRPGSSSRFKGGAKIGKQWTANINISFEGGHIYLGSFDSEEEAGIVFARARYKYPLHQNPPVSSSRSHPSIDYSDMKVEGSDMSGSGCMVCGLSSDPELVLLCDGCDNEAHLARFGAHSGARRRLVLFILP